MMSAHRFRSGRRIRRALRTICGVAAISVLTALSSVAFGANPAEEMAKAGTTGGIDPKGNSWESIQRSVEQFGHPPLKDFEERKALILLGVVGAVVAELSGTSQTLAFVIFGIGALLRFRTLLDNPKLTGKAIMVVVVGLACGMGSWAMAVFVTGFSWLLMFWLDSHSSCEVRIRLDETEDPKPVFDAVQSLLLSHRCKLQSSSLYEDKGRMVFLLYLPNGVDPTRLEHEVRSKLRKNNVSKITVDLV